MSIYSNWWKAEHSGTKRAMTCRCAGCALLKVVCMRGEREVKCSQAVCPWCGAKSTKLKEHKSAFGVQMLTNVLWSELYAPPDPEFICWSPNSQYFRMLDHLEIQSFKKIKMKWGHNSGALIYVTGVFIRKWEKRHEGCVPSEKRPWKDK